MVAVGVKVDTKAVEFEMAKLAQEYGSATVKGALTVAQLVRGDAIKSIQAASMGTHVTRYTAAGNPYAHVAAKPGAAPNTDTGRLVNSIFVEADSGGFIGHRRRGIFVGTNVKYGRWLEFGTKVMKARPWLWPAIEKNRANARKIMGKLIDKVTREHGNL